ncbi:MAG TPA: chorismate mutase [Thermoanaerobaculia bacterium]|nr:chorismate mutase [Thermoanaerobaculia bacterium]
MTRYDGISPEGAESELERLRDAIDRVDEVLVKLLNQRARYAIEIGEIKALLRMAIYSPEREKEVLSNVERWCGGPLDADSIRRLFERIIDESRRVEREATASDEKSETGRES